MDTNRKPTGWYIHFNARDTVGASKKIDAQLKAFNKHFNIIEKDIKLKSKNRLLNAPALLPLGSLTWDYSELYKDELPDFIYVRKILTDRKFYLFCKYVKDNKPDCKIIVEIHTWPYDRIKAKIVGDIFLIKDKYYNSKRLDGLVDRYATYSDDKTIFGVQTINIQNGIDVDSIEVRKAKKSSYDVIDLIWVAFFGIQHGVERVILGLRDYYLNEEASNRKEIHVHLVGDGSVIGQIKNMIRECNLESKVFFYGYKYGEELDELYDMCDMGLSVFGLHKAGVSQSSALKVREYLAKGLPVVSGCKEDVFERACSEYYLEFPDDDSAIDINRIIEFYHSVYDKESADCVIKKVRNYAKSTVDMEKTMEPVLEYCSR